MHNVFLGLDVGTNFVKAVIARAEKKSPFEICGTGYVKQSSGAMNAGMILNIPEVTAACEMAVHAAESESGLSVRSAVVGIAGELVKSSTSVVRYHREKPERSLSETEMSILLEKVQTASKEKALKEIIFETDNPHAEVVLINSAVVSAMVDGQRVNNPIGFKCSEVVIEFYTAFAPRVHVRAIEKVCNDMNLDLLAIAVDPFATCRALIGDDDSTKTPSLIIDVGGGNTSLAIIDRGGIRGTYTFGIGAKSISRDVSVWLSGLEIALENFTHVETLPSNILLCGGGSDNLELEEALAIGDWYKKLPFSRRPIVNLVEPDSLPDLKNSTRSELNISFITAIGLARIAVDTYDLGKGEGFSTKLSKILSH